VTAGPAEAYLERLEVVRARLDRLAAERPAEGALTAPDEPTGERWEWGQVWAHMAEFPAYWMARIREALSNPDPAPAPFGRTKEDPDRIGAIERDRSAPVDRLLVRLHGDLDDLRDLIAEMTPRDWDRGLEHRTLGMMDTAHAVDEFLVGHLEDHAAQLETLLG